MTNKQSELIAYLEMMVQARKSYEGVLPEGFHYWGMEDFLLQHGQWYELPAAMPDMVEGIPQRCFGNSAYRAINDKSLRYVEGIATRFIPTHHAWNVDASGIVHDCTWMNTGEAYFGVEFDARKTMRMLDAQSTNLQCWRDGFKIFRRPFTRL